MRLLLYSGRGGGGGRGAGGRGRGGPPGRGGGGRGGGKPGGFKGGKTVIIEPHRHGKFDLFLNLQWNQSIQSIV